MPRYVLAYFGEPNFQSREEGAAHQKKWMDWAGGLGSALVEPAIPLKKPHMLIKDGATTEHAPSNRLSGLSIVEASSLEEASQMAQGNPHLDFGTMEVAEVMEMPS